MSDTPSDLKKLHEEETEYKDPQGSLYRKIDASINGLIDNAVGKGFLGEIKKSILSESQFQARRGTNWVLMKGQDISGSQFSTTYGVTTLPNMLGKFPRCSDNSGSGFNFTLGTESTDANEEHRHGPALGIINSTTGNLYNQASPASFLFSNLTADTPGAYNLFQTSVEPTVGKISTEGEVVGAPKRYRINYFIRINL